MKRTKTAKGRIIDMGALAKANETTRAVGNVPMNARGDRLDKSGNVVATVQRVARTQSELATAPEKRPMSETPNTGKKPAEKKKAAAREISRATKTRDDGSEYVEIEFEDGSFKVEETK